MKLNDEQREFLQKKQLQALRSENQVGAAIIDAIITVLLAVDKRG